MAVWVNGYGEQFDDELTFLPGEEGFTRARAKKHFKTDDFNYVGTPNWQPPEPQD